jgi:hypothetical protein
MISDGSVDSYCTAATNTDNGGITSDGTSVTVNGQTFANTNIDSCTDATTGSSAGLLDAFYASVMVTAAAVVGGLAAL